MGDTTRRPTGDTSTPGDNPTFDPRTTPLPRRHVLVLMGVGTVAGRAVSARCSPAAPDRR